MPSVTSVESDFSGATCYGAVTPSQETWDTGDREVVCTLNLEDQSAVSGSAEGSAE